MLRLPDSYEMQELDQLSDGELENALTLGRREQWYRDEIDFQVWAPLHDGSTQEARDAQELLRRRRARRSMLDFCRYTMPEKKSRDGDVIDFGYVANWHHAAVGYALDRVLAGLCTRLMIFIMPRCGKSEMVSVRLPCLAFGRRPNLEIAAASNAADLAQDMSRKAQRVIDSDAYARLFPRVGLNTKNVRTLSGAPMRNVDQWEPIDPLGENRYRGRYMCAGIDGQFTGKGFDLGVIDDPFKNREQAESPAMQARAINFYTSVFHNRRNSPRAAIVLMHTRWSENDLAGYLLNAMAEGGEKWEVLVFSAIAGEDRHPLDPREPGDALWPQLFDAAQLEEIRVTEGPRNWSSLYQQRPTPEAGGIFKREWLRYCRVTHDLSDGGADDVLGEIRIDNGVHAIGDCVRFATVDLASGKTEGTARQSSDYTAIAVFAVVERRGGRELAVIDVQRGHWDGPEMIRRMLDAQSTYKLDFVALEEVAWQLAVGQMAIASGVRLRWVQPDRAKVARAMAVSSLFEQGRVHFRISPWLDSVEHELLTFPHGKYGEHDDRVDVIVYGARLLKEMGTEVEATVKRVRNATIDRPWEEDRQAAMADAPWRQRLRGGSTPRARAEEAGLSVVMPSDATPFR